MEINHRTRTELTYQSQLSVGSLTQWKWSRYWLIDHLISEGKGNNQGSWYSEPNLTHCEESIRQGNIMGVLREKPCHSFSKFNKWSTAFSVPHTVLDAVELAVNATDKILVKELSCEELTKICCPRNLLNCSDLNCHFTSDPTAGWHAGCSHHLEPLVSEI